MQDAAAAEEAEGAARPRQQRQRPVEDKAQRREPRRLNLQLRHKDRQRKDSRLAVRAAAAVVAAAAAISSRRRLRAHHSRSRPVSIAVSSQAASRWPS